MSKSNRHVSDPEFNWRWLIGPTGVDLVVAATRIELPGVPTHAWVRSANPVVPEELASLYDDVTHEFHTQRVEFEAYLEGLCMTQGTFLL